MVWRDCLFFEPLVNFVFKTISVFCERQNMHSCKLQDDNNKSNGKESFRLNNVLKALFFFIV